MHCSTLLLPALAALAAAQSTTVVSIFEGFVQNPYVSASYSTYGSLAGSVVGINAEATTYKVGCMSGAPKSVCSIATPYTVIAGPTTVSFSQTFPIYIYGETLSVSENVACSFTHTTESAECTIAAAVTSGGASTTTTTTKSIPTNDVYYRSITVTGGLSLFNSPQATQTPGAAAGPARPLITAAPWGAAAAVAVAALF